ncbi:MAG: hypothetical protein ACJA2Q_000947 [Pseudohongiellaceae bacterium]|jgi:hypothetical protein
MNRLKSAIGLERTLSKKNKQLEYLHKPVLKLEQQDVCRHVSSVPGGDYSLKSKVVASLFASLFKLTE